MKSISLLTLPTTNRKQFSGDKMFDQLSSLSAAKTSWRIKVRLTRMWPSISNSSKGQSAGLKGYNMIFLDDDDCHIHAFAYAKNWKAIEDKVEEGGLYIVSNFYTKEALGSMKPVSSKYIINFSPSTTVEKVEEDDFMIPIHKFEFTDLGDLFALASSYGNKEFPDYSADVIGVIEEYERDTEIQTMYGDRHIVRFRLTDGRNSHMVTVWADLAVKINEEFLRVKEKPVIAILASVKVKTFLKLAQISTIPSSKIYLNLDFDAVHSMRQRLAEEGYIYSERAPDPHAGDDAAAIFAAADVIETLTLKELSQKNATEHLDRYYLVNVKVGSLGESETWWYTSCINCSEAVTKLEGTFRCPECKKNTPVAAKRYKIMIVAGDESESFDFVLQDRAAKRIVGKTATKMLADITKEGLVSGVPSKIKEIVGKDLTLKIRIKHDNVLLKSNVFFASDAYEAGVTGSVSMEPSSSAGTVSSIGDNNVVDLEKPGDTPGTAKSASKKIKLEL